MKTLLVGYKASDLTKELLAGDVTCHTLDIYHRHAIEKVWHAKAICTPHLPEGPWDLIRFKTGPKLMSGELSLDLLQEIHHLLTKGDATKGDATFLSREKNFSHRFLLDFVGRERDRNDLLNKIKDDPTRVRDFSSKWFASVPGGPKLEFTSFPGCFCHRRLDEGGLALAEVVTKDLLEAAGDSFSRDKNVASPLLASPLVAASEETRHSCRVSEEGLRLLDMGCGCGLVGYLIATRLSPSNSNSPSNSPSNSNSTSTSSLHLPISLTLVDSHSRAVEAAELNAKAFGLEAEVILADNGTPARMDSTFDVFVGNPPYYSDYRIADVFLETAARALKPGGVCYTVCKNAAGLEPVQKRYFPQVEIIKRRGYAVLKSTRERVRFSLVTSDWSLGGFPLGENRTQGLGVRQ